MFVLISINPVRIDVTELDLFVKYLHILICFVFNFEFLIIYESNGLKNENFLCLAFARQVIKYLMYLV